MIYPLLKLLEYSVLVRFKIIYNVSVCVCVCVRVWESGELSTTTSCPAVPAVTACEQMSVFPRLQTQSRGIFSTDLIHTHTHTHTHTHAHTHTHTFSIRNRRLLKTPVSSRKQSPLGATLIYLCLSAAALVRMLKKKKKNTINLSMCVCKWAPFFGDSHVCFWCVCGCAAFLSA